MNIKPYIQKNSPVNGLNFNYYLHIKGGSGNHSSRKGDDRYGGEYEYILFYASPNEMEGCDVCERVWCADKGIIYGEGDTIKDAHKDYLKKSKLAENKKPG